MSEVSQQLKHLRQLYGSLCRQHAKAKAIEQRRELLEVDDWGLVDLEELLHVRGTVLTLQAGVHSTLSELEGELDEFVEDILIVLDADEHSAAQDAYHAALDDLREAQQSLGVEDEDEEGDDFDADEDDDDEGDQEDGDEDDEDEEDESDDDDDSF